MKNINKIVATALLLSTVLCSVNAASNFTYQQPQVQQVNSSNYVQKPMQYNSNQPLKGNVVMVPAGTSIPATFMSPISSATMTVGQSVSLLLGSDFYYNNKLIAPAGSSVNGSVIDVSKAKRGSMNGRLCIRFTQIITPYGVQVPISAVIKTDDSSGVLIGGTKMDVTKEYAKDLAGGSAAGALSGLVFGALAGGDVGRGAALGTAVGAGGGLIKSVWDKGNDVEIPANATVELLLTQPITVSTSGYGYEN